MGYIKFQSQMGGRGGVGGGLGIPCKAELPCRSVYLQAYVNMFSMFRNRSFPEEFIPSIRTDTDVDIGINTETHAQTQRHTKRHSDPRTDTELQGGEDP